MTEEKIRNIARLCHEAIKKWCETNDDFSQQAWEDVDDTKRESIINEVKFRLEHPETVNSADDIKAQLFNLVVDVLKENPAHWLKEEKVDDVLQRWENVGFLDGKLFENDENIDNSKLKLSQQYEEMARTILFLIEFVEKNTRFNFETLVFAIIARLRTTNNEFWDEIAELTKDTRMYYYDDNNEKVIDDIRRAYGAFDMVQFFTKHGENLYKAILIVEILYNKKTDIQAEFCAIFASLFALYMNGVENMEERINDVWQKPFAIY